MSFTIRELCIQINEQLEAIGAGISLKCVVIVGGLDPVSQAIALSKKPHISKWNQNIEIIEVILSWWIINNYFLRGNINIIFFFFYSLK